MASFLCKRKCRKVATLLLLFMVASFYLYQNVFYQDKGVKRHVNDMENEIIECPRGKEPSVDYSRSAVGEMLDERRQQLLQFCDGKELLKAGSHPENETKDRLLYDMSHNFVYCAVEKVGSTFWKRVFRVLAGLTSETNPYKVKYAHGIPYPTLRPLTFDTAYAVLQKSIKFVITRDPYSRLFSGYADKLYQINPAFWKLGKSIIQLFRGNATSKDLRCGHDVTFEEFIKYVIYMETFQPQYRDGHFIPLTDHCRPCQIKYDIIANLETLKQDTVFVLDRLKVPKTSELRIQIDQMETKSEDDSVNKISDSLLDLVERSSSCVSKGEGFRRTWRSFQYRGYIDKDTKYPLSKTEEDTIDAEGLAQMFKSALEESGEREARLNNRHLVLEEAYSQISLNDLFKLKEIFKTDCGAFGYDCEPKYIFDKTRKPTTDFLNWRTA